jgi:hypothetical protein
MSARSLTLDPLIRDRKPARARVGFRSCAIAALAAVSIAGIMVAAAGSAGAVGSGVRSGRALGVNPRTHLRPGITPMVPGGIRSQSAPAGAHLTYYGGPVLSDIKSVDVIYGAGSYAPYIGSYIATFTSQLLGSGVLDWLHEYNTPSVGGSGQTIGRGAYAGTYTITPAAADTGSQIQDSQVQAELGAQIAAGHLPLPDANTSYAIFFPHGEQICQGGSCSGVAGGFCAYHGTFTYGAVTATYQVMPDNQAGSGVDTGCGNGTPSGNETSVLTHELVETITDPLVGFATTYAPPLAWYDTTNGEIGDICNAQQGTFVGTDSVTYTVQQLFSNAASNCIVSPPYASPTITSPTTTTFVKGSPGSFMVKASSYPTVLQVTEVGALPAGVTLSGAGVLAGTASQDGIFPITLTVSNGISPDATQAFTLTVAIPPSVTSFSPTSGPVGTVVTITGTNLSGATKVTFDGVAAIITKDVATKIKVKVPIGAITGKIKVATAGGKVKTATVFTVT